MLKYNINEILPQSQALKQTSCAITVHLADRAQPNFPCSARKNFPIWEANKNQTKRDDLFLFLNSTHNAVIKFKNYITQVAAFTVDSLIEPLPVLFHDPAGHFGRNGSNFLRYHLLKTFQSLGTMMVYLDIEVAPEKKSHGVKSGECGGHLMSLRKETHAQETFLLDFRANDGLCGLLHHLVETTHFLLHVHRKDNPI
jgi:hypothetical protein